MKKISNNADPPLNNNNINRVMKRKTTVAATSPVAMGKALVLLATSCAALSSSSGSSHPSIAARRGSAASQPRSSSSVHRSHHRGVVKGSGRLYHGEFHSSMVALHYRDGDEDQTIDMRTANQLAVDAATASSEGKVASPTDVPEGQIHHPVSMVLSMMLPHFTLFPLPSIPSITLPSIPSITLPSIPTIRLVYPSMPSSPPLSKEDKEQLVMDEYLEYVERRYSRMHPKHQQHQQRQKQHQAATKRPMTILDFQLPRKIFLSTLAFHRTHPLSVMPTMAAAVKIQEKDNSATQAAAHEEEEEEEEDDPLYVLGLSSLASARLRQRLHVPRDLRDEHTMITSSTESAVNFFTHCMSSTAAAAALTTKAATAAAPGGRTSSYISLSFPAQLRLLVTTLRRLALAFAHTTKILTAFTSRIFSEILEKGGFRKSARVLGVAIVRGSPLACVAILIMFRPLFQGALKHQA